MEDLACAWHADRLPCVFLFNINMIMLVRRYYRSHFIDNKNGISENRCDPSKVMVKTSMSSACKVTNSSKLRTIVSMPHAWDIKLTESAYQTIWQDILSWAHKQFFPYPSTEKLWTIAARESAMTLYLYASLVKTEVKVSLQWPET